VPGFWCNSAATHLGEQGIPLQLIMAKTRISSVASSCGLHLYIPN
jgi:hypothetical protein